MAFVVTKVPVNGDYGAVKLWTIPGPLAWWGSVFPLALQIAWRLGFYRVVLVGCSFKGGVGRPLYAWETALTPDQVSHSLTTYLDDLKRLHSLKPTFLETGFNVVSATPESLANGLLDYLPLEEAVANAMGGVPAEPEPTTLAHSSDHLDEWRRSQRPS